MFLLRALRVLNVLLRALRVLNVFVMDPKGP